MDQLRATVPSPILRWAGSKRRLIGRLLPYWQCARHTRYIEPFVGSAAFFFAAVPERALLSDTNGELILTYREVRSRPNAVAQALARIPRTKEAYLRLRRQPVTELNPTKRAARFLFLNRHCFNGIYRTNKRGEFNVPYAPSKTGQLPDAMQLGTVARCLKRAHLACGDFETVVSRSVRRGDFVYLDPPYAVANRRIFRQYNAMTFGFDDLQRLASLLWAIDAVGASFVLSYALCPESVSAFKGWRQRRVLTQRNIAGFAAHRRLATELIVTNLRIRGSE